MDYPQDLPPMRAGDLDTADWVTDEGRSKIQKLTERGRRFKTRDYWGWRTDAEEGARSNDVDKFKRAASQAPSADAVVELCEARLLSVRCCELGHLEMLRHLFEEVGVCQEVCDVPRWRRAIAESGGVGNSPVMAASWSGYPRLVRYCLEERGCSGDVVNHFGLTAVFMAAHCGHHECVELLVNVGKVDASKPIMDGNTPLCSACNAVITQADHPPQHWAQVKAGALATVRFLLRPRAEGGAGLEPQSRDPAVRADARHPLVVAAQEGCMDVVRLLLEAGADPEGDGSSADTFPLAAAAVRGHAGVVSVLLDKGADPKRLVTVRAKVTSGPDRGRESDDIIGLLDLARGGGHGDVFALLRAAGASSVDGDGDGGVVDGGAGMKSPEGTGTGTGTGMGTGKSPSSETRGGGGTGGTGGGGGGGGGATDASAPMSGGKMCANCGASGMNVKLSRCGGCKSARGGAGGVAYCGRECQKTHRPMHKDECQAVAHKKTGDTFAAVMLREMAAGRELSAAGRHKPAFARAKEAGAKSADAYKLLGPLALTHLASALTNLAECSYQTDSFEEALDQSRRAESAAAAAAAAAASRRSQSLSLPLWMSPEDAPSDADEWRDSVDQCRAASSAMTGKILAAVGGLPRLTEAGEKISQAVETVSALVRRGYDVHSQIVGYHFDLAGIYARMDRFSFDEDKMKSHLTDSELAIRAGIEAAKTAGGDDPDARRLILEAAGGGAFCSSLVVYA